MASETYELTGDQLLDLGEHFAEQGRERGLSTDTSWSVGDELDSWLTDRRIGPQTAITAALGKGALVVDKARLREALVRTHAHGWHAAHDWHSHSNRERPGYDAAFIDQALEELTAPEVEA